MDEERLIIAVQQRPVIFDKSDKNHHNRDIIRATWEGISKEVGSDVYACKSRWGTLRDYFLKKYRESRIVTPVQSTNRKRKWHLYDTMSFLIPYYFRWEADGYLKYPDDEDDNQPEEEEEADIEEEASPRSLSSDESLPHENFKTMQQPRKRKRDWASTSHFDMEVLKALRKEPEAVDANELFFKSLLPTMKKLNDIQTLEFRSDVQTLLLKYLKQSVQPQTAVPSGAVPSTSGYNVSSP